ncbi:MAG TPA: hypothetical protein ENN41_00605, partial [Sediminispirochaeta sp.]|nr:hypothetical protein [Sediminispirochaeta sp.]
MEKRVLMWAFVWGLCSITTVFSQEGDIEHAVRRAAEGLSRAYMEGRDELFRQNLSIMTFEAVGDDGHSRAVSRTLEDIFGTVFSRSTVFSLVERRGMEQLLEEQRLQLMGITESDSTVDLGNIKNAHALLLGSVNAVGDSYRVNVRLVEVETGEMVSESLVLDRSEMLETKRRLDMEYISAMGVGISILGMDLVYGGNSPSLDFNDFSTTVFGRPFGVEYKYRPATWLMFGVGIETYGGTVRSFESMSYQYEYKFDYGDESITLTEEGEGPFVLYAEGYGLLANSYFVWPMSRRFSLFASLGVEYLILDIEGYFHPDVEETAAEEKKAIGNGFGLDEFGPQEWGTAPVYRLRAGFEWFLSPRAAFSLKAGWDFGRMEINLTRQWHLDLAEYDDGNGNVRVPVDLSGFTIAPSISVYF